MGRGAISFVSQKTSDSTLLSAVLSALAAKPPSKLEVEAPASLVQPSRPERLIDVSTLAPDGLGDLSGAHPFLAQRPDARAVESDRATLVNPLRICRVDTRAANRG